MTPAVSPAIRSVGHPVTVRPAPAGDVAVMVDLVRALADYERAVGSGPAGRPEADGDPVRCRSARFSPTSPNTSGTVVGFAVWFVNFSTWTGHHGIYLEDLFVQPTDRGLGAGRALLRELARLAVARGYTRVEWAVLDWNEPAIGFYRHLGARPQDEWTVFRLAGADLTRLGGGSAL